MPMEKEDIASYVRNKMVETYFPKEYEQAQKEIQQMNFEPHSVVLLKMGLFGSEDSMTAQQKAVSSVSSILIDQLSEVKNITPDEVKLATKRTLEWAAKNCGQVNETMEKTNGIVDRLTKVHTNEIRASISQQIQDVRKDYFAERKKEAH
ncbi:Uncharacterised protein [uncultured archaeon]|nr:Uncharacterised protein [uncultured archaeon]